jgi:hypothetical protein
VKVRHAGPSTPSKILIRRIGPKSNSPAFYSLLSFPVLSCTRRAPARLVALKIEYPRLDFFRAQTASGESEQRLDLAAAAS